MRKKKTLIVVSVIVAALALGFNWARVKAGGLHNLVSRAYWEARLSGKDLYQPVGQILKHGNRNDQEIALTFDDGPHPQSLPKILSILKRERIHATFFLVGLRIKQHPELARQIILDGHEVGNHTQDHLRLTDLTDKQATAEIVDCEKNFESATGRRMSLLRPPGMRFDPRILGITQKLGYQTIGWTDAAKDFDSLTNHLDQVTPAELGERVTRHVENGSIILLHDTPETADALDEVLRRIKNEGYRFVTVSQMLGHLPNAVKVAANPLLTAQKVALPPKKA